MSFTPGSARSPPDAAAFAPDSFAAAHRPPQLRVPATAPTEMEVRLVDPSGAAGAAEPLPHEARDVQAPAHDDAATPHSRSSLRTDDGPRTDTNALERRRIAPDDAEDELTEHLAHATEDHHPFKADGALPSAASPLEHVAVKPPRASLLALLNRENRKVAVVPLVGGWLAGYAIGLVPFHTQLYAEGTNCALYTTKTGCESVPFADCVWHTASTTLADGTASTLQYCGWPALTCRAEYPNDAWLGGGGDTTRALASCLGDAGCTWSYSAKECQNPYGYTTTQIGIFAGSMIVGNMIGAMFGGPIVTGMGTRLTFLVSGIFCTVACVMSHVDASMDDFWLLISSRFLLGLFVGLMTVACPLYVHENADPLYKAKVGTVFQVAATFGGFVVGVIGLCVGQTIHYDHEADPNVVARMQTVVAGQTLLSVVIIFLGIFSTETKVKFTKGVAGALDQSEYSYRRMWRQLLLAVALTATLRFTGFNALANFGPKMMASYNIAPYLGAFIIMTLNFVGALLSFPCSLFASPRKLFMFGSCFTSCVVLFMCGVPVYPGVATSTVTNVCAVVGICVFIVSYEMFVGPSFFVLCQEIFPPSFRPRGNSFAQLWQFIINLVINLCYSMAVESFSGGPSGNQHKGQAIVFTGFGAVGLLVFLYELFYLRLWDEAAEQERKRLEAEAVARLGAGCAGANADGGAARRVNADAAAACVGSTCMAVETEERR